MVPHPALLVFLTDNKGKFTATVNPAYEDWIQKDQLVLSWIKGSLHPTVLSTVASYISARKTWVALEERFASKDQNRILQLRSELLRTLRGDLCITDYLDKVNAIVYNLALSGFLVTETELIPVIMKNVGPMFENTVASAQASEKPISYPELEALLLSAEQRLKGTSAAADAGVLSGISASVPSDVWVSRDTETVPSSSSTPIMLEYDVFLSFRGEDTRNTITDHLHTALQKKKINVFRDEEKLERGQPISPGLLKAIEASKFAVIILSKYYATSTWCLDELAYIVQCKNERGRAPKLQVFPVFYQVEPSEVKEQTGDFGKAFAVHEINHPGKVEKWKEALREVATVPKWHVKDRYESKVTEEIAEKISSLLLNSLSATKNFIGIASRMEKVESCLDLRRSDVVCTIGIWGMGGIGKTALARQVFNDICNQFECSHFVDHVGEKYRTHDLVDIQKDIVKVLLDSSNADIPDVETGARVLSQRLRRKKVLIVLDDADDLEKIKSLADGSWLGPGSRVIITTRDKKTLINCGVVHDNIYEVEKMTHDEAFQLLCQKAFNQNHAPDGGYKVLSNKFVKYASGLPLALEVLGSYLNGRDVNQWSSALATLKQHPRKGIDGVLEISFNGLVETEKDIFLDIACFFQGEDQRRVEKILESCDFDPKNGIPALVSKSLLKAERNRLWMHGLIQQMGQNFVLRESPKDPGNRSRLWVNVFEYKRTKSWHDEVLTENTGTNAVQGMFLCLPAKEQIVTSNPFRKMRNLRLLKISNANFSKCPEFFSKQLRLLEWHEYPLESLPPNFQTSELVELNMPNSQIEQLWQDRLSLMDKLVQLDLSNCQCLTKSPDFSKVPNLEVLILEGCVKLSELHPTIWDLQQLVSLNLKGCECLESLPSSICMKSLRTFILSGCSMLKVFPEIAGNMEALSELHLDGTGIRELPISVEHLSGLILLSLRECKSLLSLPSIICSLTSLKHLHMSGCSQIDQLPENLGNLEQLLEVDACETAIRKVPCSVLLLKKLRRLCLHGCKGLQLPHSFTGLSSLIKLDLSACGLEEGAIPDDIGYCLPSLQQLGLSENNFFTIPESISQLSELTELTFFSCRNLQSLPEHLPSNLKHIDAHDCPMLRNYPKTLTIWASDKGLCFVDCHETEVDHEHGTRHHALPIPVDHTEEQLPKYFEDLIDRDQQWETHVPHNRIPDWCSEYSSGTSVTIQLSDSEDSNSSWIGVALFVVFEILEMTSEMEKTFCYFDTPEGRLEKHIELGNFQNFKVGSHGLCIYAPGCRFTGHLNKANQGLLRASISTRRPSLMVKGCGIHLVSHQNAAKFAYNLAETANQHLGLDFGRHCKVILAKAMELESSGDVTAIDCRQLEPPPTSTENQGSSYSTISTDSSIQRVQSLLLMLYEGLNGRQKYFSFRFPHPILAIPHWFDHHFLGNVALCNLPQNLFDENKWVGLELYVIFSWSPSISSLFDLPSFLCVDLIDQESSRIPICITISNPLSRHAYGSHELVVFHVPRVYFSQHEWSKCQVIRAFFRTTNSDVAVEMSGARLVYEEDLGGLIHSLSMLPLGRPDILDELYMSAQLFVAETLENPLHEAPTVERIINAEEGEMAIARDSFGIQRQQLAESGQELLIPEQDFNSLLQKYRCYFKQKQGVIDCGQIIVHSKRSMLASRDCIQQNVAAADDPPVLLVGYNHVHILAETQLYGSYNPVQWKEYLQVLLQLSNVATLSLKGDIISVIKRFSPLCTYNFDFPRKEILEWFKGRTRMSSNIGMTLPPKLYDDKDWRGLVIVAAFSAVEHPTTDLEDLGSEMTGKLLCHLTMGEYCLNPVPVCTITKEKFKWLHVRGFIWLTYIPRVLLSEFIAANCDFVEARIYNNCPALTVDKIGIRLLYQQEEEELKQAIIQSWTSFFDNVDLIRHFVEGPSSKHPHKDHNGQIMKPLGRQTKDFDRDFICNTTLPPHTEIMEWFSYHDNSGPTMKIQLPLPPCSDTNWIGLALYAIFSDLENPTASLEKVDPEASLYLICHLESEDSSWQYLHHYQTIDEEFKWLHDEGFIWLSYIPRKWYLDQLKECRHLEASFASEKGGLPANLCGLRLVYQHDVEEFKQHCNSVSLLFDLETNDQQYHDGEGEAGPSRNNSSTQNPLHERLGGTEGSKLKDKGKQVQEYPGDVFDT